MKLLFCSILLALAWTATDAAPVRAQEAAPLSLTQGEVTLKVTELAWKPYAEFQPRYPSSIMPAPAQVLTFSFALEGAPPARRPFVPEGSVRVYAVAPDGRRIEAEQISPTQRVWNLWPAIDPRWDTLQLQFDWFPPDFREQKIAPEIARWADVPVPAESDAPQILPGGARQITTESGVRLQLDAAMLRVRPNDTTPMASFYGRWLPPADDPTVCAEIARTRGADGEEAVTFDNGAPIQDRTHHINVSRGREVDGRDDTPGTFTISAPLRAGAKTANLLVEVRRIRPRIKSTPAGAVAFQTKIPMPAPAPGNGAATFVAQQPLGTGVLKLEALKYSGKNSRELEWSGQLLLEEPSVATTNGDPTDWRPTSVKYSAPGGFNAQTGLRDDNLWRTNGAALQQNQNAWQVAPQLSERKGQDTPQTATIETKWERVRTSDFTLRFAGLPAPAPGQIVDVEKTVSAGEFGTFTIRKIGSFTAEQPLSPLIGARMAQFQPPYGMAVVIEHTPSPEHQVLGWNGQTNYPTWKLTAQDARDDRGRELGRNCDDSAVQRAAGRDELAAPQAAAAAPQVLRATLYLLPASAQATTFEFSLRAVRRTITDEQTVTFSDIALPAP